MDDHFDIGSVFEIGKFDITRLTCILNDITGMGHMGHDMYDTVFVHLNDTSLGQIQTCTT